MGRLDEDSVFGFATRPMAIIHELGEPLEGLSIGELGDRIAALQAEIGRLEEARTAKETTRRAADAFFNL